MSCGRLDFTQEEILNLNPALFTETKTQLLTAPARQREIVLDAVEYYNPGDGGLGGFASATRRKSDDQYVNRR
jgi:hypothetical protein